MRRNQNSEIVLLCVIRWETVSHTLGLTECAVRVVPVPVPFYEFHANPGGRNIFRNYPKIHVEYVHVL